jgi:hypothetical protein
MAACVKCVKEALQGLIYPLVEAYSPSPSTSYGRTLLATCLQRPSLQSDVQDIHSSLSIIFPLLNNLVSLSLMSEHIVIQLVYTSIGPFFVSDGDAEESGGKKEKKPKKATLTVETVLNQRNAMMYLKMNALALLRNVSPPSRLSSPLSHAHRSLRITAISGRGLLKRSSPR